MKGVWLGLFGINIVFFIITISAFASGFGGIHLPVLVMFSAALCYWMYHYG